MIAESQCSRILYRVHNDGGRMNAQRFRRVHAGSNVDKGRNCADVRGPIFELTLRPLVLPTFEPSICITTIDVRVFYISPFHKNRVKPM